MRHSKARNDWGMRLMLLGAVKSEEPVLAASAAALLLSGLMLAASVVTNALGGPTIWGALFGYVPVAAASALICVYLSLGGYVLKSATEKTEAPVKAAWAEIKPRLPLLALSFIVLPFFLAAFTAVKSAMPILAGFRLDPALAEADALIFGRDVWRIAHAIVGPFGHQLAFVYHPVWGGLLACSLGLAAAFAEPRRAGALILATLLTWMVGGILVAYALSSAGPIFLEGPRFSELQQAIANERSSFYWAASYIHAALSSPHSVYGGGISAMPSMHIAQCVLYMVFCRGTRLFWPSAIFAVLIFIGSLYSGLHYFTDAPVAAAIAILCWYAARTWIARREGPPQAIASRASIRGAADDDCIGALS